MWIAHLTQVDPHALGTSWYIAHPTDGDRPDGRFELFEVQGAAAICIQDLTAQEFSIDFWAKLRGFRWPRL